MSNHAALKKLTVLRDKLELRKDDIAVGKAALEDENRELESKMEQLELVRNRIAETVREMDALGREGRAEKVKREQFAHEDDALRTTFSTILDQGLKELQVERERRLEAVIEEGAVETELREVSVLFEDEEGVFRISDASYTFDALLADACRYFELHPLGAWPHVHPFAPPCLPWRRAAHSLVLPPCRRRLLRMPTDAVSE